MPCSTWTTRSPGREVGERGDRGAPLVRRPAAHRAPVPEQLGLREADEAEARALEPDVGAAHQDGERLRARAARRRPAPRARDPGGSPGGGRPSADPARGAAPGSPRPARPPSAGSSRRNWPRTPSIERVSSRNASRARRSASDAALDARAARPSVVERVGLRRARREERRVRDRHRRVGRQVVAEPRATPRRSPASIGRTRSVATAPVERCVVGSNVRSDSTSSPASSSRTGSDPAGEKTSTIPPRSAHCPTPVTVSTRS